MEASNILPILKKKLAFLSGKEWKRLKNKILFSSVADWIKYKTVYAAG